MFRNGVDRLAIQVHLPHGINELGGHNTTLTLPRLDGLTNVRADIAEDGGRMDVQSLGDLPVGEMILVPHVKKLSNRNRFRQRFLYHMRFSFQ